MAEPTQPLSIRLATSDIDHLAERAQDIQAVLTTTTAQTEAATRVEKMFEDLLRALSGQPLK